MQSDMVSKTSGCNWTVGALSDARAFETSGFCDDSAMFGVYVCGFVGG